MVVVVSHIQRMLCRLLTRKTTSLHCMYIDVLCIYLCTRYGHYINQSINQPCKVANASRGQRNKEKGNLMSPFAPENLVSRDGFGRPIPRQPAHSLHSGLIGVLLG